MKIFSGEYTGNLIDNEGNRPSNLDEIGYNRVIDKTFTEYGFGPFSEVRSEITFKPNAEFVVTTDVSEKTLKDFFGEDNITDDLAKDYLDEIKVDVVHDAVMNALSEAGVMDYEDIDLTMVDFFVEDSEETISESIEGAAITDVEAFIKEAKQKFPGSDAYYDGDTNSIIVMLKNE